MSLKEGSQKKLLIAGGGTGGHVLPGIAVAQAWCEHEGGSKDLVLFVGAHGGMEERLVPQSGFKLCLLDLGGLNRVSFLRRIKTCFQLPLSIFTSYRYLREFQPDCILGVGGYASGPLLFAAYFFFNRGGKQLALLEPNSVAGWTNRILSLWVKQVFLSFDVASFYFPKNHIQVTGNPIRSSLKRLPSACGTGASKSREREFVILIMGGSQGSSGLNTLIIDTLPYLTKSLKFRFIHQSGRHDLKRVQQAYKAQSLKGEVFDFIETVSESYAQATLVICRAGSSTLAELAAVGRASILVPLPTATNQHQEKNAQSYAQAGAARLFQQAEGGLSLSRIIVECWERPEQIRDMEQKVIHFDRKSAASDLVEYFFKKSEAKKGLKEKI